MGEGPKHTPEGIAEPGKKPEEKKKFRVVRDSRGEFHHINPDENLPDALEKIRDADK